MSTREAILKAIRIMQSLEDGRATTSGSLEDAIDLLTLALTESEEE